MGRQCTSQQVREMELLIMSRLNWQVQTVTASEVSLYFLRKYWVEVLQKPEEAFPQIVLLDMIRYFARTGLLLDSCLDSTYAEISIASVGLVFNITKLPEEAAHFITWVNSYLDSDMVNSAD